MSPADIRAAYAATPATLQRLIDGWRRCVIDTMRVQLAELEARDWLTFGEYVFSRPMIGAPSQPVIEKEWSFACVLLERSGIDRLVHSAHVYELEMRRAGAPGWWRLRARVYGGAEHIREISTADLVEAEKAAPLPPPNDDE